MTLLNYLLNIVSDDGKPDYSVGIDFSVPEFIFGLICGIIISMCFVMIFNFFKNDQKGDQ